MTWGVRVGYDYGRLDFCFGVGWRVLHHVCLCAAVDQDLEAGWPGFVLRDAGALFVWGGLVVGLWVAIARAGGDHYESCDRYINCDCYGIEGLDGSEG